ncbi:MAG: hypothetical protein ACK4OO_02625 [bacterium]
MPWTNAQRVLNHILLHDLPAREVADEAVKMNEQGKGYLLHRGIVEGSEIVKIRSFNSLEEHIVLLPGYQWVNLPWAHLIPGEMVVASDWGAQNRFLQEIDYAVDWRAGRIRRRDGSAIPDNQPVYLWCQRYEVLSPTLDYQIDYLKGSISQVVNGPDLRNARLWIDYQLSAAGSVEGLVDQAIEEAEERIKSRLKEEYKEGLPPSGLVNGATELAVAVLCRALATYALSDGGSSPEGRSKGWLQVSQWYETVAYQSLKPYLHAPLITTGSRSGNSSWEWS